MKFSIIIAAAVGMAVVVLLCVNRSSSIFASNQELDARAQSELAESLEATRNQLKTLRAQLLKNQYDFQRRIDVMEKTVKSLSKSKDGETDWESLEDESLSHEERLTRRAEADHRQGAEKVARLVKEEIDYIWSSRAEDQLTRNFEADDKYDFRDFEVKCRTTHCSVRGEFGDSKTREQKINWLMTLIPWNTTSFYQGDDIGGTTGAIYVMRGEGP
jgi:hypothetical protein